MRFAYGSLSALIVTASLVAQIPNNRHLFFPGEDNTMAARFLTGVNAATRVGGANTGTVECFSDVSAAFFRGVGSASNTSCRLTGQVYVIQDQDQLTQDFFQIIVRRPVAPDGLPDATAAGIYAQSGNIQLPPPPGTGGIAWQFTTTWAPNPITIDCQNGYYVGVVLLPQVSATDFTLTQTASAFAAGPPMTGDNPRVPAPKFHAARVDQPAAVASRSTSQRTLSIIALTDAATFNVGNLDGVNGYKSYGIGGMYPSVARGDGLTIRVEDGSSPGGFVVVFMSNTFFPGGLSVAGVSGAVWTGVSPLFTMGVGAIAGATPFISEVVIAPPGTLAGVSGSVNLFALTINSTFTTLRLTNAQAVSF
jgi:hypothetical protein